MNFMNAISALTAAAGKVMPLALNYNAVDDAALLDIIVGAVVAVIVLTGGIVGVWEFWDGQQHDNPGKKAHGIKILAVTAASVVALLAIVALLKG